MFDVLFCENLVIHSSSTIAFGVIDVTFQIIFICMYMFFESLGEISLSRNLITEITNSFF